jgi:hypothetical protein
MALLNKDELKDITLLYEELRTKVSRVSCFFCGYDFLTEEIKEERAPQLVDAIFKNGASETHFVCLKCLNERKTKLNNERKTKLNKE